MKHIGTIQGFGGHVNGEQYLNIDGRRVPVERYGLGAIQRYFGTLGAAVGKKIRFNTDERGRLQSFRKAEESG